MKNNYDDVKFEEKKFYFTLFETLGLRLEKLVAKFQQWLKVPVLTEEYLYTTTTYDEASTFSIRHDGEFVTEPISGPHKDEKGQYLLVQYPTNFTPPDFTNKKAGELAFEVIANLHKKEKGWLDNV